MHANKIIPRSFVINACMVYGLLKYYLLIWWFYKYMLLAYQSLWKDLYGPQMVVDQTGDKKYSIYPETLILDYWIPFKTLAVFYLYVKLINKWSWEIWTNWLRFQLYLMKDNCISDADKISVKYSQFLPAHD